MTLAQFAAVLQTTKLPVVYLSFGENDCPEMPFVTYFETATDNFAADGKVYHIIKQVQVDLWTAKKDTTTEALLESAFDTAGIYWNKEMDFDEDEQCMRATYSLEF